MNLNKKIKGFTLVELIVVMAIIVILAGMGNLGVQTLVRDNKLETLNDRAQLVYAAFQDMLLDCEVSQDNSVFEPHSGDKVDDIIGAVIFFRISRYDRSGHPNVNGAVGLGDEIHVNVKHKNPGSAGGVVPGDTTLCSRSFWAPGSTNPGVTSGSGAFPDGDHGASHWKKLNAYISGRLDETATGTYCVAVDLENYQVLSVICREIPADGKDPKTGLYSEWEVADSSKALGKFINYYSDESGHMLNAGSGFTVAPPLRAYILKNRDHQKAIASKVGINIGAYPYGDDLYTNVTRPSSLN